MQSSSYTPDLQAANSAAFPAVGQLLSSPPSESYPSGTLAEAKTFFSSVLLETSPFDDYLIVKGNEPILSGEQTQDDLYKDAAEDFGASLDRLVGAYEADPDKRRDLSQDIHFQLWRSFERYDARCSLRTWTYRVAHNVAASHVMRERRKFSVLVSLEELEMLPDAAQGQLAANQRINLARLSALIQQLKPLDRQVIISYLEDMDAASIGEITGLSPANVATRIHRTKRVLAKMFREGGNYAG
jgi:RNA polymerase sigma-70 factor (ECF subfamily)